MADNTVQGGSDTLATDDIGGVKYQRVKVTFGADGSSTDVSSVAPLPVDLGTNNDVTNTVLSVVGGGVEATAQRVTIASDSTGVLSIDDNGGSLTVDGTVTVTHPAIGAGTEAAAQRVTIATDSTGVLSVDDGGGSLTVDGTVAVSGSVDTELPAAAALADNTANPTVPAVGSFIHAFEGTTWDRVQSTSSALNVSIQNANLPITDDGGSLTVDGTVTVQDGGGAISVDDNGTTLSIDDGGGSITVDGTVTVGGVAGDVAHDGADSGNPVKIGAVASTALPTAVVNADRVNIMADKLGRLITAPFAPRGLIPHNRIALTTTTETTLLAAGGAGVFRDLSMLIISNESATEVRVDIRDSTAGTIRLSMDLAADGGGAVIPFPALLEQATANNNWTAQLSSAVSTVYVTAVGVNNS